MKERELLLKAIKKEKKVRQKIRKHFSTSIIFQPLFFSGSKYNQELAKLAQENSAVNIIDFSKVRAQEKSSGQWIEKELEKIVNKNQPEFSLICFLNLNEINGTALEKSLLPFFDCHQNAQHKGLNLSNFILVATCSTSQLEKISPPLLSRLKCVNLEEVELPKSFLEKHFSLVLVSSILLVLIFLFLILRTSLKKQQES